MGVLPGSLEAPWAGTLSPRLHNLQSTEQGTGSERYENDLGHTAKPVYLFAVAV